jgi:MFS family permease
VQRKLFDGEMRAWFIGRIILSYGAAAGSGRDIQRPRPPRPGMMADPRLAMAPSELSTLFSMGTLAGALGAPYLGGLVDRYGARSCLPAGCVLMACALLTLSAAVRHGLQRHLCVTLLSLRYFLSDFLYELYRAVPPRPMATGQASPAALVVGFLLVRLMSLGGILQAHRRQDTMHLEFSAAFSHKTVAFPIPAT